jgi:hypothetical protein
MEQLGQTHGSYGNAAFTCEYFLFRLLTQQQHAAAYPRNWRSTQTKPIRAEMGKVAFALQGRRRDDDRMLHSSIE